MVKDQLGLMAWYALVLMRVPLRAFFTFMAILSLVLFIAGIVTLPFGGVGDGPIWAQMLAVLILIVLYGIWTKLAFHYDTLVFKLTPKDREIILSE